MGYQSETTSFLDKQQISRSAVRQTHHVYSATVFPACSYIAHSIGQNVHPNFVSIIYKRCSLCLIAILYLTNKHQTYFKPFSYMYGIISHILLVLFIDMVQQDCILLYIDSV